MLNGIKKTTPEEKALNKYLKQFNCTGCSNRCYLDSIRCGGGQRDRKMRVEEYNKLHS